MSSVKGMCGLAVELFISGSHCVIIFILLNFYHIV